MQKVTKKSRLHEISPVISTGSMTGMRATPVDCFCLSLPHAPSLENLRISHEAGFKAAFQNPNHISFFERLNGLNDQIGGGCILVC